MAEEDGKILLVRRAVPPEKGKWGLPAGFMEWDETPEETGLKVELEGLFGLFHYRDDFRGPGIIILYRARRVGDDASEIAFFSPEEIPGEIAFESNRRALALWKEEIKKRRAPS